MQIPVLAHVAAFSFLVPAVIGLRHWRRSIPPMKIFILFFVYSLIHLSIEFTFGRMGIANHFLSNIYMVVNVECILYLYIKWNQKKYLQGILKIAGIMYFVFWLLDMTFFPFPIEFRENIDTFANGVMLIASVIMLYQLTKLSDQSVTSYSVFWIAVGTSLYAAGTIVVFTFSNTVLEMGMESFNLLWHINWVFTIISNIIVARSFSCKNF
jgi:hypothetical protein